MYNKANKERSVVLDAPGQVYPAAERPHGKGDSVMILTISSRNFTVSDDMRVMFEKKAAKLERYLRPDAKVVAMFSREGTRDSIEITIPLKGSILRAEDTGYDVYTSMDTVLDKIEHQIRRNRKRIEHRLKNNAVAEAPLYFDEEDDDQEEEIQIVRTKRFAVKPMDAYEAVEQMEMLGHNFFVYLDVETNDIAVVYKRNNGTYGLIEPEIG